MFIRFIRDGARAAMLTHGDHRRGDHGGGGGPPPPPALPRARRLGHEPGRRHRLRAQAQGQAPAAAVAAAAATARAKVIIPIPHSPLSQTAGSF